MKSHELAKILRLCSDVLYRMPNREIKDTLSNLLEALDDELSQPGAKQKNRAASKSSTSLLNIPTPPPRQLMASFKIFSQCLSAGQRIFWIQNRNHC